MSVLILSMDVTIVNVALPAIQSEFHALLAGLQWLLDAYTLVVASFLMLSGSISDGVTVLSTGRDFVGENPVWNELRHRLYWVDVLAPALRWFDPATRGSGRLELPHLTAGINPLTFQYLCTIAGGEVATDW